MVAKHMGVSFRWTSRGLQASNLGCCVFCFAFLCSVKGSVCCRSPAQLKFCCPLSFY